MGRSSASCHYQFSANRLISRVHVAASFKTGSTSKEDKIEIVCSGWNGIKIHCRGNVVALGKGDTFCSSQQGLDVIVDAHENRIRIKWPLPDENAFTSGSSDEEISPTRNVRSLQRHSTPPSPLRARNFIASPVSPSRAVKAVNIPSSPPNPLQPSNGPVVIFEDTSVSPERFKVPSMTVSQSTQKLTQSISVPADSQDGSLAEPQDFSDQDEENDPVVHSFGPFGANLLPRMASFTTGSQTNSPQKAQPLGASVSPSQRQSRPVAFDIKTHVVNQLAYSRLSSTPLSTIISHFPADAGSFSHDTVTSIISQTECVGEITREGKDAYGKPLESEYYYIPDKDEDEMRREAIVNDLRKPGLRSCRKQHKVRRTPCHMYCAKELLSHLLTFS